MWLLDMLFPPRNDERIVRAIHEDNLHALVAPARRGDTIALLPYEHPHVRACIKEAKFHANKKAARLLGAILHDYLIEYEREAADTFVRTVFVPMPLSDKRRTERGYNQVEKILHFARIDEQITHVLTRVRDTKAQSLLDKESRTENVRGAFTATALAPHTHYVVIDDVCTTGATMQEALETLRNAGATSVAGIALAYA